MKAFLIMTGYNEGVLFPPEASQFLPMSRVVKSDGYGLDRTTWEMKKPLEVIFIDERDVLDSEPAATLEPEPPSEPEPSPVPAVPTTDILDFDEPF